MTDKPYSLILKDLDTLKYISQKQKYIVTISLISKHLWFGTKQECIAGHIDTKRDKALCLNIVF